MKGFFFIFLIFTLFSEGLYGQSVNTSYDSLCRQIYIQLPDSSSITEFYDNAGRLIQEIYHDPCSTKPKPIITASGPLTFCAGDSVILSTSPGLGCKWSTGDTTSTIKVLAEGHYSVSRLDSFSIPNADTIQCYLTSVPDTVIVKPIPNVVPVSNQSVCNASLSTAVAFTGSVTATIYNWSNNNTDIGLAATGNDVVHAFTVTNSTSAPIFGVISVTPSAAGCIGPVQSFTITANPTPDVSAPSNQTVCSGTLTSTVNFTGSITGTFFNWINDNTSIGLSSSGTGNIGAFITTNSSSSVAISTVTVTPTANGCTGAAQHFSITVNPLPSTIGGTTAVCVGQTTTLNDTITGGSWASGSTAIATIGSGSGVVTGASSGTTTISYTLSTGCFKNTVVTVAPLPAAITGAGSMCGHFKTTFTDSTSGGTWSSSDVSIATIGSINGIINTFSAGVATITYSEGIGCIATKALTVNAAPSPISGSLVFCAGTTTTLIDSVSGGIWSSSSTDVATCGSTTGIVTGIAGGTAKITYAMPGSCIATATVTVIPVPSAITGDSGTCVGSTFTLGDTAPGGSWSSSNTSVATISVSGIVTGVSAGMAIITYNTGCALPAIKTVIISPTPSPITGSTSICAGSTTTLSCASSGSGWSSSNAEIATIGSASGLLTGVSPGMAIITYAIGAGCFTTTVVTVNRVPSAITGPATVCSGSAISLSSNPVGGTWSSSASSVATVDSAGLVSSISAGTTTITYTLGALCSAMAVITVNPQPAVITGNPAICLGSTGTLSETTTGGVWSSTTPAIAAIGSTGIVSGIAIGTSTISYTFASTGCARTTVVTVAIPPDNTGTSVVCVGRTTMLANTTPGGTWSSSNGSIATVVSSSGVITGVASGTALISYIISAGCRSVTTVTVITSPATITGTTSACVGSSIMLTDATGGGTWSSSSITFATVGSVTGIVTGISAGTPIITYTAANGCFKTMSITVKRLPGPITGNTELCVGATSTLIDGTGVSWTSSAPTTASIGSISGVVTGVSAGTATITFLATTGCTVTTIVTVSAAPSVAAITGPSSLGVGHTITLADATPGGIWNSSSTARATVTSGGIVTGITVPAVIISYTVTSEACHFSVTKLITITASKSGAYESGMANGKREDLLIYPNPNQGSFTLIASLNFTTDEEVSVEITDMLGQVIYKNKAMAYKGRLEENIVLENTLASSEYLLTIRSKFDNIKSAHFIVGK